MKRSFKRLSSELSSEIIDTLGGTTKTSRVCNLSRSAISQWRKLGIPDPYVRLLREKFKKLPVMKNEEIKNF